MNYLIDEYESRYGKYPSLEELSDVMNLPINKIKELIEYSYDAVPLSTEVKGNNTGLYCDDCGAWIKWLGKEELRAFEYAQSQNKEADIHLTHEDTKKLLELPYVVLDESDDEELRINGKSVCCHKRLYPADVLEALAKHGIINFVHEK